jgi:hypothetical protein
MAVDKNMMLDVGSEWRSNNLIFVVDSVIIKEDGTWVYYHNKSTNEEYNCLVDAFLARVNQVLQ